MATWAGAGIDVTVRRDTVPVCAVAHAAWRPGFVSAQTIDAAIVHIEAVAMRAVDRDRRPRRAAATRQPPVPAGQHVQRKNEMLRSTKDLEHYAIGATDGDIGHVEDFYFDDDAWVIRYDKC